MQLQLKAIILVKVMTKIRRNAVFVKYILMITVCQLSSFLVFLMNSTPLNSDLSVVSIENPFALPTVFILGLFLWALDRSSFIYFDFIP